MERRWPVYGGVLLVAAALCPGAAAAEYEPVFEPAACWFTLPPEQPVECGFLTVPEDRADPESADISIGVAILRHPGGTPEPDPILRLHGGPGGGYLSYMEVAWTDDATLFDANRDIIAFDQRGQGKSTPLLDCPEVGRAYFEAVDLEIDGKQLTGEEFLDYMGAQFGACHARLSQDHDLSNYDTAANAADAADLMRALGYTTYNVHAGSYGTTAALRLMRDHPEGIRAVILDAPSGPSEPEAGALIAMRQAFDEVLDGCAADDACNAAFPDLRKTWQETLAKVEADPPLIEATDSFSGERFNVRLNPAFLTAPLRLSLTSMADLRTVPLFIDQASKGDYGLAAKGWGGFLARAGTFVGWGSLASVRCSEPNLDEDAATVDALIAESPTVAAFFQDGPLGGHVRYRICNNWPVDQMTAAEVAPVDSDIPTLMLVGQVDAATDFEGMYEVADHLPNVFGPYVFPAMGHIVGLGGHECPAAIEAAFLTDPTVEPDNGCIAEMAPIAFVTELGSSEVDLVAYDGPGYAGVVPGGWNELQPGFFARSDPAVDKTLFVQMAAPNAEADGMVAGLLGEFGLTALPAEPLRRLPGESLTWEVYLPAGVVPIIVATAETDGATYLAALIAGRDEFDDLIDAVLVPALQALTPAP